MISKDTTWEEKLKPKANNDFTDQTSSFLKDYNKFGNLEFNLNQNMYIMPLKCQMFSASLSRSPALTSSCNLMQAEQKLRSAKKDETIVFCYFSFYWYRNVKTQKTFVLIFTPVFRKMAYIRQVNKSASTVSNQDAAKSIPSLRNVITHHCMLCLKCGVFI